MIPFLFGGDDFDGACGLGGPISGPAIPSNNPAHPARIGGSGRNASVVLRSHGAAGAAAAAQHDLSPHAAASIRSHKMDGYLTEDRLLKSGPPLFFNRSPFLDRMTLRDIHITVLGDYRKAVGKFGRPATIFGKEHHVQKEYEIKDYDLVVEVLPTPDDLILKWDTAAGNDLIKPKWRVRVARDPAHSTRNLKDLMIAGPVYELGKVGSKGPFVALSADKAATILS